MIAYVFSGQGAQNTGMGLDIFCRSKAGRQVFEMADQIRPGTSKQCFEATKEELSLTVNTQPCLFTVDLAAARAMDELGYKADMAAGFSLGEIAALAYTEVFSDEAAFRLVCKRAEYMHNAALESPGSMVAVLGLSAEKVSEICGHFTKVEPVNFNCPGQTVVAGLPQELEQLIPEVKAAGGKARPLAVSGAFHSSFMNEAAENLGKWLIHTNPAKPRIPLYSNKTGALYGSDIKELIEHQVCSPVKWQAIIENMAASGVDTFIEVGAGKVLCGLISKTLPRATVLHYSELFNQNSTGGK